MVDRSSLCLSSQGQDRSFVHFANPLSPASRISLKNSIAKNQEMMYTFLHGSLPLVCIHRHHRLVRFHVSLPALEFQPSVFWVKPPACRDSKRWHVDRCRRVTASGGVIGLICHMARPAPGLESRTSFPLCTYTWTPPRDKTRLMFDSHNFNLYSLRKSTVCLTTLLVIHSTQASMLEWLFKKEFERTWQNVVTKLMVGLLSHSLPGWSE